MKPLARVIFRFLARHILKRYQPIVIGVAGSVGKTSTKEAIAAALADGQRTVRKTEGSFNAEIGVPVTIITGGAARTSPWAWFGVMVTGIRLLAQTRPYPRVLVLEMGSDKPGDLADLLGVATPTVGVLTSMAPEHLEFFGDESSVIEEESLIVRTLSSQAQAVINVDDERSRIIMPKVKARVISYGWHESATVRADTMTITNDERGLPTGMILKVVVEGSTIPIALPGVIGRHQVLPILGAIATTLAIGDRVAQVLPRLSGYRPPRGRMRLFEGRDASKLIDDSYNASPEAVQAALETMFELHVPGKKYAILGQMSELGASADEWHDRIGGMIGPKSLHQLVTVGPLAKRYGDAAIAVGFPATHVINVADAEAAATHILPQLGPGDLVLVKGSRYASRLERAVRILLAHPDRDAKELVGG